MGYFDLPVDHVHEKRAVRIDRNSSSPVADVNSENALDTAKIVKAVFSLNKGRPDS
ncbi:hypothetical protein HanIR_Chr03g0101341 [Helianthus annuus]|nr:hypothetical protein HanIR_Chr03g0101341 [Helianthus annuus]